MSHRATPPPPASGSTPEDTVIGLGRGRRNQLEMTASNKLLLEREMARVTKGDPIKALMVQVMQEYEAEGAVNATCTRHGRKSTALDTPSDHRPN